MGPTQRSSRPCSDLNALGGGLLDPESQRGGGSYGSNVIGNTWSPKDASTSYVVPHKRLTEELQLTLSRTSCILLVLSIALSCGVIFTVMPDDIECMADAPKWKFCLMFNLMIMFCILVVEGKNPEMTMLGIAAIAVLCDCLKPGELFHGAASGAVISLALLFPIAKAMADTGAPAAFIGALLGNPTTVRPGIARMFMALILPSGIFNNTPIVAMMIPVLRSWSERLGFDLGALLMPLSFCAQAGGNMTLMGSSINFVAASIFSEATGDSFAIGFFSLTFGGTILYVVVGAYCTIMAPKMLVKAAPESSRNVSTSEITQELSTAVVTQDDVCMKSRYTIPLVITPGGPLVGICPERAGLHRIRGVSCAGTGAHTSLERDMEMLGESWEAIRCQALRGGDILQVGATAEGVAALRLVKGIELGNQQSELAGLGAKRRRRILVEASVANRFVGKVVDILQLKHSHRCAVVAISSPTVQPLCRMSYNGYKVKTGDVFLIEAFKDDLGSESWLQLFSVVRSVPNSSPPATGRRPDTIRALLTGIGLLTVVCLSITNKPSLGLPVTCVLLLCFLFAIKALTPDDAYRAINSSVLLTIVGALALGKALQTVGLANCFAAGVVGIAEPFGPAAILCALYIATFGLGMFVTNAAVVAIMGAIGVSIAMDNSNDVTVGQVCLTVVYASSACWCTPYGYQTNLMVAKEVGYSWGDFIKFGLPLQAIHLVATVTIAPLCASIVF